MPISSPVNAYARPRLARPYPGARPSKINAAVRGFAFAYILVAVVLLGVLAVAGISAFLQLGTPVPSQKVANRNLLQQAVKALIAGSTDTDNDGIIEAPAYVSATPSPAGGGGIPSTSAAPKNDAYGTPLGYCSWDNGSVTSSANRSPGSNPALQTSAVFAVISAGPDHIFQTSCAAAQSGSASGDDEVRMVTLSEIKKGAGANIYLGEAVPDVYTLESIGSGSVQATDTPGTVRYVKSTNNLYQWNFSPASGNMGVWQNVSYNDHDPGKNKLINGNFGIWQRTNGSAVTVPADGAMHYVTDRWALMLPTGGVSSTVQQYTIPLTDNPRPAGATYALQIPVDQGNSWLDLDQTIEGLSQFSRKTITLSFWARALSGTVTVSPYVRMVGDNGSYWVMGYGQSSTIASTWQKITRTFVVSPVQGGAGPNPAFNGLLLHLSFYAPVTGTVLVSQVQLEDGPQATSFDFRPPAYELMLCQRYYERFDQGNQGNETSLYFSANGQVLPRSVQFRVPMMRAPTVTLTSCVSATNIDGTTCTNVNATANAEGFIANIKSATASPPVMGDVSFNWTADAEYYETNL